MEASLVTRNNIPFATIPAAGVHGVGLARLPGNLLHLARGYRAAQRVLADFRPEVVFTTGGYVAVPVALANRTAALACYVPDIEPAMALRWVARKSHLIAVTTEESRSFYVKDAPVAVTGYPTRPDLEKANRNGGKAAFGFDQQAPLLLVFGGSRGARSINEALWANLTYILFHTQVLHITGSLDWPRAEAFKKELAPELADRYKVFEYLHEEMGAALASADLVVSRAGAATLGEYPLFGLPSILVPYPHAWKYQQTNAAYLAERGAAIVLQDERLREDLPKAVDDLLLKNPDRLAAMRNAAAQLHRPGAAERIAKQLEQLAESRRTHG